MAGYVHERFLNRLVIDYCPSQPIASTDLLTDSGKLVNPRGYALFLHPHGVIQRAFFRAAVVTTLPGEQGVQVFADWQIRITILFALLPVGSCRIRSRNLGGAMDHLDCPPCLLGTSSGRVPTPP